MYWNTNKKTHTYIKIPWQRYDVQHTNIHKNLQSLHKMGQERQIHNSLEASFTAIIIQKQRACSVLSVLWRALRECVCALNRAVEARRDVWEVDRRAGGRDVLLFHQNFTGKRTHQTTAEKMKKKKMNRESWKKWREGEKERGRRKREVSCLWPIFL